MRVLLHVGALLLMWLAPGVLRAEDMPTIRVAYFEYPPHHGKGKNGEPFGACVEVWEKYLAKNGNFKIKWVGPFPFARLVEVMKSGEADVWMQLFPNKERREWFHFPQTPIGEFNQMFWVRKDDPATKVSGLPDIVGKKIGKLASGYVPPFIAENQDKLILDEIGSDSSASQNVKKLTAERVWGLYFVSGDVIRYTAIRDNNIDQIKSIPITIGEPALPIYTAMWKGIDPALKKRLEDALEKSKREYKYTALVEEAVKGAKLH